MSIWELFIIAVGLSMDAFAVSICKGLSVKKLRPKHAAITGLYFGGFQCAMPLIGYFLGIQFKQFIISIDHWIAFILLGLIGANMIREAFGNDEEELNDSFNLRTMVPLAIATSIDALAVGVSFAALSVNIWQAAGFICCVTFVCCLVGHALGHRFGLLLGARAQLCGGVILVAIGVKILAEHLMGG